jgi:hypothetical protein
MAPPTAQRRLTANQIAGYARAAGFAGDDLATAVAVALAESSGDTHARAPSGCCHGLWQIHARAHNEAITDLWDPAYNARVAHRIWTRAGGWGPWEAYTRGLHTRYLPQARTSSTSGSAIQPVGLLDDIIDILPNPLGVITDAAGDVVGAAADAVGDFSGDAIAAAIDATGLDELPRKALTIGIGMILLATGAGIAAVGLWRLSTTTTRAAVDHTLTATGAATTLGALI